MRFSYLGLQEYFAEPLPPARRLAESITLHSFEVESVTEEDDDFWLEVKILPDRAADAKNPPGLAREISAILGVPLKESLALKADSRLCRQKIDFSTEEINSLLGTNFQEREVIDLLGRQGLMVEKSDSRLVALVPPERLDLNIKEDLAEEVGRIFGWNNVPARDLPFLPPVFSDDEEFVLSQKLRAFLAEAGFDEVFNYTLVPAGRRAVIKPCSAERKFLRANLTDGLREKVVFNLRHLLFDDESVKIFEIGKVFPLGGEEISRLAVAVGYRAAKYRREGVPEFFRRSKNGWFRDGAIEILEVDLVSLLPRAAELGSVDPRRFTNLNKKFTPPSPYPRIVRDIAVLVSLSDEPVSVGEAIVRSAGEWLSQPPVLFDEFNQQGQKSLAFRLAFQSRERTLTAEEINAVMAKIVAELEARPGWRVRD